MILYINTVLKNEMIIAVRQGRVVLGQEKIAVDHNQAERLVPAIEALLHCLKINLKAIKKIIVASYGSSFTSLRIGVVTANALAYALKIPVEAETTKKNKRKRFGQYYLVEPHYQFAPKIGVSKKLL